MGRIYWHRVAKMVICEQAKDVMCRSLGFYTARETSCNGRLAAYVAVRCPRPRSLQRTPGEALNWNLSGVSLLLLLLGDASQ
jgi:hypothetical protein